MWTAADRERYGRDGLRYPSDLTDAERALIAPLIRPAKRGGRRRSVAVREIMNGLLYVLETGCQWRHLPRDLPPRSTVHGYLQRWDWDGTLEAVHHQLYVACREQAGKGPGHCPGRPTAAILDSKSVKPNLDSETALVHKSRPVASAKPGTGVWGQLPPPSG